MAAVDYYRELGVCHNASFDEIRTAYRKMAMKWHPDRWSKVPSQAERAKKKFQDVQEAYSVLSDGRKRSLYNAGLYDVNDEDDEGFCDFVQEMVVLMEKERSKKRTYGLEELQGMLFEMMAAGDRQETSTAFNQPSRQVAARRSTTTGSTKRARAGEKVQYGCPATGLVLEPLHDASSGVNRSTSPPLVKVESV